MTNTRSRLLAAALLTAALPATTAVAAPDHQLAPQPNRGELTWKGQAATAANLTFASAAYNTSDRKGLCGKDAHDYCEEVLVDVTARGHLDVGLTDIGLHESGLFFDDFDLFLYASDAAGVAGELLDKSAEAPGDEEHVSVPVRPGHYLAKVVYVSTALGGYTGHVELTSPPGAPAR